MICGKVKKPCFLYVFHKRVPVSFLPRFYPVGMDTSQRIHIALVVVDHGPCEGRVWGKHLSWSVLPWCNPPPTQLPIYLHPLVFCRLPIRQSGCGCQAGHGHGWSSLGLLLSSSPQDTPPGRYDCPLWGGKSIIVYILQIVHLQMPPRTQALRWP